MNDLRKEIIKIYDDYLKVLNAGVEDILDEAGKTGLDTIEHKSPRRTGKYAGGFVLEKTDLRGQPGRVIRNRKYPGLTHLLENGHLTRGGSRRKTRAQKHFAPAEERVIDEIMKKIKSL